VIIIDEDDVCLKFSEEDWFLWETFIHKIKDTGVIVLIISVKRTNLVAVDKLVTVVDKKLDICSDLEFKSKGNDYYVALVNVNMEFNWKSLNNDVNLTEVNARKRSARLGVEDSYDGSSLTNNIYRGIFRVENVSTFETRKIYKVYGVNDGLNLLSYLETCLKGRLFDSYELLDKYNIN